MTTADDARQPSRAALTGEFVGTFFLLAGVVGSGIMAENLTDDVGLQLLQNALATGGVLLALIWAFAAVSGAHFNPAVTLVELSLGNVQRNVIVAPYTGRVTIQ